MATREEMIAELERRDMIAELERRDANANKKQESISAPGYRDPSIASVEDQDEGRSVLDLETAATSFADSYTPTKQLVGAMASPTGALKSLQAGMTGTDMSSDEDVAKYLSYRDAAGAHIKGLQEQNPGSSMVGTGSGLIASGLAIPGSTSKQLLSRLAQNAAVGAGTGGYLAAKDSNYDLARGEGAPFLQEVAEGAALGGAIPVAAEKAVLPAASWLSKQAQNISGLGDVIGATDKGLRGVPAFTEAQKQVLVDKFRSGTKMTIEELEQLRQVAGEAIGTIESQAAGRGTEFNLGEIPSQVQQEIESIPSTPTAQKSVNDIISKIPGKERMVGTNRMFQPVDELSTPSVISSTSNPYFNIGEAQQIKREMQGTAKDLLGKTDATSLEKQIAPKIAKGASDVKDVIAKGVPELDEANTAFQNILKSHEMLGLDPSDLSKMENNPLLKLEVEKQVTNLMTKLKDPSLSTARAKETIELFKETISKVPGGKEVADKMTKVISEDLDNYFLSQKLGHGGGMFGGVIKSAAQVGNVVGYMTRKALSPINPGVASGYAGSKIAGAMQPKEVSKNLYEADNDSLGEVASSLAQSDDTGVKSYADTLKMALETDNTRLKNAVLFQISQNKKARALINR